MVDQPSIDHLVDRPPYRRHRLRSLLIIMRADFVTSDPDEAERILNDMHGNIRLGGRDRMRGLRFMLSGVSMPDMRASRLRYGIAAGGGTSSGDELMLVTPTSGVIDIEACGTRRRFGKGDTMLLPAGASLDAQWNQSFETDILQLPHELVASFTASHTGIAADDLRFESIQPASSGLARYWRHTMNYLDRELRAHDSALAHPLVPNQATQAVAAALLAVFPTTTAHYEHQPGPGWVAPASVRRAAAFIDEHTDEPITLDEIAQAAGTSGRAVQHGFTRHYGTTPTGYLRQVRLRRAHHELQAADPTGGDTVAAVAARWGFAKPGNFAKAYSQTFGVLPSHTLRT